MIEVYHYPTSLLSTCEY